MDAAGSVSRARFLRDVRANRFNRAILERWETLSLSLYASHGLQALYEGRLAPNPLTDHRELFLEKAASYRRRWPWLRVETG